MNGGAAGDAGSYLKVGIFCCHQSLLLDGATFSVYVCIYVRTANFSRPAHGIVKYSSVHMGRDRLHDGKKYDFAVKSLVFRRLFYVLQCLDEGSKAAEA